MSVIFIITGKNVVGKSELSQYIHKKYNIPETHILGLLRPFAAEQNLPVAQYAKNLYRSDKTAPLRVVLPKLEKMDLSKGLIIEGVNSNEELRIIEKIFTKKLLINIFIESEKRIRVRRMVFRHSVSKSVARKNIKRSDIFRSTMGISEVKKNVDLIIVNNTTQKSQLKNAFEEGAKKALVKRLVSTIKKLHHIPK